MEPLERRELLAVVTLADLSVSTNTGEKPQSKVWEHDGHWWTVMPSSVGTWVSRLDGTSWTPTLQLSNSNNTHADVKADGNLAHVLLFDGGSTQLASIEYNGAVDNYKLWSQRPQLVNINLNGIETATIDLDSTGRMWLAGEAGGGIHVWYSDGTYTSWSAPVTIASGVNSDDIAVVTALPNDTIGVLWSNQSSSRFGFRIHVDGMAPQEWMPSEVPASQSAAGAMADDHLNVAVSSDGTLYAAVKTSYDSSGKPEIALLVRRPWGTWDNLYEVDGTGTRPIVLLNEVQRRLIVAYTSSDSGGDILYRETSIDNIAFGPRQTLIAGSLNNATSTKQNFTDEVVVLAAGGSKAKGVLFSFEPILVVNQPPLVSAGADQTIDLNAVAPLDGTASDDGVPRSTLTTSWTKVSGPGNVTFVNSAALDTSATFGTAGQYVLRLTVNDGELSRADDIAINVVDNSIPSSGSTTSGDPVTTSFQDGLFPSVVYAGTRDTQLYSSLPSTNFGKSTTLVVDGKPDQGSLLRWDVSYIPAGSIIVSAEVELYATNGTSDQYEVYALQRAWDEISATWEQFAAGQRWSAAGALGLGDYEATVLAQAAQRTTGAFKIALNDAGLEAAQSWIDDPATNFGLILQDYAGANNGLDFASRESSIASQRPKLTITYRTASESGEPTGPVNVAPVVSAGADQTIQLPASAVLNGAVSDDGVPTAGVATLWTKVSGLGTVTFGNAAAASTTASFSQAGTYVLRLTADDGQLQSSDTLTLTVQAPAPVNQTPFVSAGTDQTIQLPASAVLNGAVTDDGLPTAGVTTSWTKVSGPGTVTFANAAAANTTANFSQAGTYVLQLTANDGQLQSSDTVTVTVTPLAVNLPPAVSAGLDQAIQLPASVTLNGTVADDGLPKSSLTISWAKVSGPGTVAFANAAAANTTASFSQAGTYVLRLTADDGQLQTSDDVSVTVELAPPIITPVAPVKLKKGRRR